MDRLYNVTIEYLVPKQQLIFHQSTICLSKDGAFLVMDSEGNTVRFVANNCKVDQIAAHVIIIQGFTDKPQHVTAYCMYSKSSKAAQPQEESNDRERN